jgi:ATP-dependent helicase/nuclease subunit B
MPQTILLSDREPLIFKAARWLITRSGQRPLDLSHCAVLVPTSGSGRRLRAELVRMAADGGKGLLSPVVLTPMGLLQRAAGDKIAGRLDALLAWTQVISEVAAESFPLLLSGFSDHRALASRIGQSLRELCALLAEAGLTPVSAHARCLSSPQEDRWKELKSLYEQYLNRLAAAGLEDSDAAHIRVAKMGIVPENIGHVIVAGVPDLNPITEAYLRILESAGVAVTVLIDAPDCELEQFDAWGRPDPKAWSQRFLPLRLEDFVVAADPVSEAQIVARLIGSAAVGVCVADSELVPFHLRAMRKRGLKPYDPAGKSLAPFECATLARLWLAFASNGRVSELRTLLEHPVFLRLLCRESHQSPTAVLSALDELQTKILVETLDDAVAFIDEGGSSASSTRGLIAAVEKLRRTFGASGSLAGLSEFLRTVYSGREVAAGSAEGEALAALASLLSTVLDSPLGQPDFAEQIFCEEMKNLAVFGPHDEGDIDLNGWLEAQWLPNSSLIVSGCTEGALPARIAGHPFVPDSVRADWHLHNNLERFARDTYVLHCLLAARQSGTVRLTLCRVGADGEPAKPSRLLFRCSDAELIARIRKVFEPIAPLHTSKARERAWPLEIPARPPPSSLRVTAFRDYLQCPLRFYLKHVLGMRRFESPKVEMDALDFGSVFHETLEAFAREEAIRDSSDFREIEAYVLTELDAIFLNRFGRRLSLPLRVQQEGLRARLRQFARIQAPERRAGWRIRHGELRFEEENTLHLAGLPIVGALDRVDVHEETGQRRILDYKTSAKRKSARSMHLAAASGAGEMVQWRDLQLPLYRALAEFLWPGEPLPPLVGYFLLPERIEESGIDQLILDEALFASAKANAEMVAERISRGIFWPPGEVEFDDFANLFLGEDPEKTISEKSKGFLSGRVLIDTPLAS